MKTLLKTLLVTCALLAGAWVHAQSQTPVAAVDAPAYQVTAKDKTVKQLIERWAENDEVDFEWNASYDIEIKHHEADIKEANLALSKVEDLHDAVMLILKAWRDKQPIGKKVVPAPLDFCYYEDEAILIYTTDQPNCGHVEPSQTASDDE